MMDQRIKDLLERILNPEELGLAASPRLRDTIRFAFGRPPVETDLVAHFPPEQPMLRKPPVFSLSKEGVTIEFSDGGTLHPRGYEPGPYGRIRLGVTEKPRVSESAIDPDARTQWFKLNGLSLPIHPGEYEYRYVDMPDTILTLRLTKNGDGWSNIDGSIGGFFRRSYDATGLMRIAIGDLTTDGIEWRGLANEPAAAAKAAA